MLSLRPTHFFRTAQAIRISAAGLNPRQSAFPFTLKVSLNAVTPQLASSLGYTTCSLRVGRKVTSALPLRNEPFFVTGSRLVGTPQDPSAPLNQFACLEVNTRRLLTPTTSPHSGLIDFRCAHPHRRRSFTFSLKVQRTNTSPPHFALCRSLNWRCPRRLSSRLAQACLRFFC